MKLIGLSRPFNLQKNFKWLQNLFRFMKIGDILVNLMKWIFWINHVEPRGDCLWGKFGAGRLDCAHSRCLPFKGGSSLQGPLMLIMSVLEFSSSPFRDYVWNQTNLRWTNILVVATLSELFLSSSSWFIESRIKTCPRCFMNFSVFVLRNT